MDQLLEKLFESVPKVRIMRLFIQNGEALFSFLEVVERVQIPREIVRKELFKLLHLGIIKKRLVLPQQDQQTGRHQSKKQPKKQEKYLLNIQFPLIEELKNLIIRATTTSRKSILSHFKKLGRVKLAVLSGIFLNTDRSRTDILVVGDDINRKRFERFLAYIESELGKTVAYTIMDTDEFKYRMQMFDRFLRDILEYPHEKLINKLNI